MRLQNNDFTAHRFYPWLVITLSSFFLFYKYVLQVSPSIMADDLMHAFHINGAGFGNLAATFFYSFLITQLFVGVLLDKYSPRLLTTAALLCCALGTYYFSNAGSLLPAMSARTLMGVGAAFATVSYMKMASLWFKPDQFAFVSGFLVSAAMLGAIAGQTPLSLLVQSVGWRQSLWICSVVGLILAILFYSLVRDGPKQALNAMRDQSATPFSWSDIWAVLSSKQNWLITLYSGLVFSPIDAFAGLWSIPFLKEAYHLSQTHAASFVSFIFLGLGLGSPLLGLLSDRLGYRRRIMIISGVITLISITWVIYVPQLPLWLLAGLFFIFGFSTGAFMLGFVLGRELNKLTVAATVVALINTGDVIFSALTEPLIGRLLDSRHEGVVTTPAFSVADYHYALSVVPIYILFSLILLLFIRESHGKQKEQAE